MDVSNELTDEIRFDSQAKLAELKERLNKNLSDYHERLMRGFGPRELIDTAGQIIATSDAHYYMTNYHDFSDADLDFYLQFQNPLEIVADEQYERISDLSDMSFVMDHIAGHRESLAEDYPLMDDVKLPADLTLRRCMNVDLELYLGKIAEKIILHYPNDWNIDKEALQEAATSNDPEQKRLIWHVCSFGTHLKVERDTFIRDTGAFDHMTNYRQDDPDMFGYVVEITGMDGQIIKGNIFEVGDYAKYAQHIRDVAEPLESLTLIYSDEWGANAGKAVNVSRREYDNDRHRFMSESGNVVEKVYHPQDKVRLAGLISKERSKRMALPIASPNTLLRKMADRLAEIRKPSEAMGQDVQNNNQFTPAAIVTSDQDFENKMTELLPNADTEGIRELITYAKELDESETITKNEFFNDTFSEFFLVKQGYGEEIARQILDVCKSFALNSFEIRGAAYHLQNGVEQSKIGQLAADGACVPPNEEPFSTGEALNAFESGTLYSRYISKQSETHKPPEVPEPSTPKQRQSLANRLQAAGEKVKAQDAQNNEIPVTGKKGREEL